MNRFSSIKKSLLVALLALVVTAGYAQLNMPSADIYLGIRKLKVLGSVLYVAAHPDDENTRLLAYLAKDKLYRTGYLSLTRGDGGQNLIGDEQGVELGLIRTQELLSARRIDGAEQFFTRAFDFGYSKTPVETFAKWDREKILSDVVWVIRRFQPDVIITRFPTTGEGGHGHHTASAILANEAFTAAADPKRFPEQLDRVKPWQARRILWNTFNFGGTNTTSSEQFNFDVGGYNAVLGKSYGEIAADSRSQHKSQGFGVPRSRGEALEYFRTTGGTAPAADLLDDVTSTWQRVPGGAAIDQLIDAALAGFDFTQPQKSVPALVAVYAALRALPAGYWRDQKLEETKSLIRSASGLWLEAVSSKQFLVQGDSLRLALTLNNRLGAGITLSRVRATGFDTVLTTALGRNRNFVINKTLPLDRNAPVTQPYWLKNPMSEGSFNVKDQGLIGRADVEPAFNIQVELTIEGQPFVFEEALRYKYTDPVKGELYQPVAVLPRVEVSFAHANNLSINGAAVTVQTHLRSNSNAPANYSVTLQHSDKWTDSRRSFPFAAATGGEQYTASELKPKSKGLNEKEAIEAAAVEGRDAFGNYRRVISYDHIPTITYFPAAMANLVQVDVQTVGKRIGYIVGAGDRVPEALEEMGFEVTLLGDKELSRNNLQGFDAIISGVRAYNTNEWLNGHYEKLMHYVENGGNLIVQYNTSNQIGPVRAKIGPFPFNITRNRITDENAAVSFLQPGHPVLNYPNKITGDDFTGWVQERSIYHAVPQDPALQPVLRMADPGEAADEGSLLTGKYGKGYFTYTGLVFFRELPAGVPGAYRLLANLIALNHKKDF